MVSQVKIHSKTKGKYRLSVAILKVSNNWNGVETGHNEAKLMHDLL